MNFNRENLHGPKEPIQQDLDFEIKENFVAHALVADDEEGIRSLLVENLKSKGFTVDVVPSAQQAIYDSVKQDYDIFLLDVSMGNMGVNGIDAGVIIHSNPKNIGKPIIFLSSSNVKKEAARLSAVSFEKPASLIEVASKAQDMVKIHRAGHES
jgi:CheY-like chemotaxis protein